MKKKSLYLSVAASTLLAFSVLGAGCKKEEPKEAGKVSATETTQTPEQTKSAGGSGSGIFSNEITIMTQLQSVKPGATLYLPVKVKNTSSEAWIKDKSNPIHLAYHWRNAADKKPVVWDGKRTFITKDVAPGEEIRIDAKVIAPDAPGTYIFEVDMVKDGQGGGWFGAKGSKVQAMNVTVK